MQASLSGRLQPGDEIIHSSKLTLLPAVYFDDSLPQIFIADPPGSSVDTLAPATRKVLGVTSAADIASAAGDARRIWFIIFQQSMDEYAAAGQGIPPQLAWMSEHYVLDSTQDFGDLRVYLFTR